MMHSLPQQCRARPAAARHSRATRLHHRCASVVVAAAPPPQSSRGSTQQQQQQQQVVLQGQSYEDIVDDLAKRLLDSSAARQQQRPTDKLLVGIAGAPGSGKTTLSRALCRRLNALAGMSSTTSTSTSGSGTSDPFCVVVPMDGFHYYRRQLDAFEDPAAAHARRGAPWTFDAEAFVACVRRVRERGGAVAPSFDHGVGDPVEGGVVVGEGSRVVLVEGNYLFLADAPWVELRPLFDETVFVDCPIDVAMRRVTARQLAIGLAPEASAARVAGNDRPNAEMVAATAGVARLIVPSTVAPSDPSSLDENGGSGNSDG